MKVFLTCLMAALFLCVASAVNAQTDGCYVSSSGLMYYETPTPANPTTYFEGASYYVDAAQCTGGGLYFTIASGPSGNNCWAHYKGNGTKTNSARYNVQGQKATFNLLVCPIDEYTLFIMAILAGVGFFFLRRMNLNPIG